MDSRDGQHNCPTDSSPGDAVNGVGRFAVRLGASPDVIAFESITWLVPLHDADSLMVSRA